MAQIYSTKIVQDTKLKGTKKEGTFLQGACKRMRVFGNVVRRRKEKSSGRKREIGASDLKVKSCEVNQLSESSAGCNQNTNGIMSTTRTHLFCCLPSGDQTEDQVNCAPGSSCRNSTRQSFVCKRV